MRRDHGSSCAPRPSGDCQRRSIEGETVMPNLTRFVAAVIVAMPFTALARQAETIVYKPGNGVSLPSVVREVTPEYTQEAKDQRIEGRVGLECVVRADGSV